MTLINPQISLGRYSTRQPTLECHESMTRDKKTQDVEILTCNSQLINIYHLYVFMISLPTLKNYYMATNKPMTRNGSLLSSRVGLTLHVDAMTVICHVSASSMSKLSVRWRGWVYGMWNGAWGWCVQVWRDGPKLGCSGSRLSQPHDACRDAKLVLYRMK